MVDEHYRLMCSNPVSTARVAQLRGTLERVRTMTLDENQARLQGNPARRGAGGQQGRRSRHPDDGARCQRPLEYNFQPIDSDPVSTMFQLVATI
jgi:hypothetical protein